MPIRQLEIVGAGTPTPEQKRYQDFFMKTLKGFGVDSPDDLDENKKTEFYNKIDDGWDAENETD